MKNPWKRYSKINPQRDDGNRQICNDVFHALVAAGFTGAEYKIILAIIDKTWGFGKNDDSISIGQFAQITNLNERTVQRTLRKLNTLRVVYLSPLGRRVATGSPLNKYSFNKHYDTWLVEGCQTVQGCQVDHPPKADKGGVDGHIRVTDRPPTKETLTKEIKDICPQQDILDLYHGILPGCIHHNKWVGHKKRMGKLNARWKDKIPSKTCPWHSGQIKYWENLFEFISKSDFLMGRIHPHWQGFSLDWLVIEDNFLKTTDGHYSNNLNLLQKGSVTNG